MTLESHGKKGRNAHASMLQTAVMISYILVCIALVSNFNKHINILVTQIASFPRRMRLVSSSFGHTNSIFSKKKKICFFIL